MKRIVVGQRVSAVDEFERLWTGEVLFIDPDDQVVLVKVDYPNFEGHGGHGYTTAEVHEKAENRAWWFPPDLIEPLNEGKENPDS